MCGICGMVNGGSNGLLQRMCDTLVHRGPDSQGAFSEGPAHLGVRRLAVIDLPGGDQPIASEDGNLVITFNGEIYNYRDLRKGLVERGHTFRTQTDTEVVLHLYEEEGERCLEALNGMFGLAIWNRREQELFLARDRLGEKPLFLFQKDGFLAWSSEMKSLRILPGFSTDLNFSALNKYLQFLYIPAPDTIFLCCQKLKAGHWLKWKGGATTLQRYWKPSGKILPKITMPEAKEMVREKVKEAVRLRMKADVPLGAFLSGGLDSSAIVAFMSQLSDWPVKTFTMGYARKYDSYNEWTKADLVSRAFETEHHEYVIEPRIKEIIPQIISGFDEPFADSSAIPTYLVSQVTRREVTVALSGIGGDEAFFGYPRYLGAWLSQPYSRLPKPGRALFETIAGLVPETSTSTNYGGRLKRFVNAAQKDPFSRYLEWVSYCRLDLRQKMLQPPHAEEGEGWYREIWEGCPYPDYLRRIQYLDSLSYLSDDLLCMGDRMSMAHSLELRVPFCDHELIEFTLSLPAALRLRGFALKSLLKSALSGILPKPIIKARKQGFMIPLASWLQEDLYGFIQETMDPQKLNRQGVLSGYEVKEIIQRQKAGETNLSDILWALLVFQLWMEQNKI